MNQIIETLSWIPFKLLEKIGQTNNEIIRLDFNNLDINKTFKFKISKDDEGLSSQLKAFGFREPINLEYHYKFVDSSDTVLDIGANIGLFTILSENAKRIICVEPLKQAISILKKNVEMNNLKDKTKIINAAVGEKDKLIIEVDKKLNLSKIVDKKGKNTYEIKSFKLSYLVKKYKPNFLRMDVEGYEYEILYKKIPKTINKISIEFHTVLLGWEKVKKLIDYFEEENFNVKYFIEDLPIRLYPFHNFLKKIGLLKKITYVKKGLKPKECFQYINKGRTVKYLFLER